MTDLKAINLTTIDISGLELSVNPYNLRKDLHIFANYLSTHDVKRTVRGNHLPKLDERRLAKIISGPDSPESYEEKEAAERWLYFIDRLLLNMGFVDYDTEGEYRGYSSVELSYPENYMEFNAKHYDIFLKKSYQKQENDIADTLTGRYSYSENEFLSRAIIGRLNRFDFTGCATGVMPSLNFEKSRKFLFEVLKNCKSNVWYSTASLVHYMKTNYPFFLIPEKPNYKNKYESREGRYANFYEGDRYGSTRHQLSEKDKNAFERVEGRYIERFLEGIPLLLGYVTVAYDPDYNKAYKPQKGRLKAFKLNDIFFRYMQGKISEPRIVVQPNFELFLESEIYPAKTLSILEPLTDLISEDTITILRLQKKKITASLAADDSLDITKLLESMSSMALPPNVVTELKQWAGLSEMFVLYDGFSLLESKNNSTLPKKYQVENISPSLKMVQLADELFSELEKDKQVPIRVNHSEKAFKSMPGNIKSIITKAAGKKTKNKQSFTLKRSTWVTLYFPDKTLLEQFQNDLNMLKCPIEINTKEKTIGYFNQHEALVNKALKNLKKEHKIKITDIRD